MAAEGESGGMTGYIKHHLEHLHVQVGEGAFWRLHIDSIFFKLLLATLFVVVFIRVASRARADGVPGKLQCAVEMVVEFVDGLVKETFPVKSRFVAPLAITIFCLVFLMNFMDMVPVDLLPATAMAAGIPYLRVVPTADLSTTLGMALCVFLLIQFYAIKHKGVGKFVAEMFTHFAVAATVRQHVRRRADLHPDRLHDAGRQPRERHHLGDGAAAVHLGFHLDRVPHPGDHAAGLHLHDADDRLSQHVGAGALRRVR